MDKQYIKQKYINFIIKTEAYTMNKNIVVALGHSALGRTFPEQKEAAKNAASAIADLASAKFNIVITHSNGPQVGMIHSAMAEFSRLEPSNTVAPISICSAMSQG